MRLCIIYYTIQIYEEGYSIVTCFTSHLFTQFHLFFSDSCDGFDDGCDDVFVGTVHNVHF